MVIESQKQAEEKPENHNEEKKDPVKPQHVSEQVEKVTENSSQKKKPVKRSKEPVKEEDANQEDQRVKLQKVREKGLRAYKKRLLHQLEADCKKKLMVINILFLFSLSVVGLMYYAEISIVSDFKITDFLF